MLGACQETNSNSNDKSLYGRAAIDTSTPEGQRFYDAYTVLETKCMNCHTGRHSHWASYVQINDWYGSDHGTVLVTARNLTSSGIVSRLTGWGAQGGMPEGDSNLSAAEYQKIKDWIQAL